MYSYLLELILARCLHLGPLLVQGPYTGQFACSSALAILARILR